MPRVPESREPQLRPLGPIQPDVQAPPEAFGGGQAAAELRQEVTGLARDIVGFAAQERRRAQEVALYDADAKLAELETTILYDPKAGALNTRGERALDSQKTTFDSYRRGVEDILKEVKSSEIRAAVQRLSQKRWAGMDRTLQVHIGRETQQMAIKAGEAKFAAETRRAVAAVMSGVNEDETARTALAESLVAINNLATSAGAEKNVRESLIADATQQFHSQVLTAYLAADKPLAARKYLSERVGENEMTPKSIAEFRRDIDGRIRDQQFKIISDEAVSIKNEDGTVNLGKALELTERRARALGLDAQGVVAAMDNTQRRAGVADAVLKDQRDNADRSFFNEAIALQQEGKTAPEAEKVLFTDRKFGFDATDRLQKLKQLYELYSKPDSFYQDALNKMNTGQKLAWKEIERRAEGTMGDNRIVLPGEKFAVKERELFLNTMLRLSIGKTPEQMLVIADDQLKKRVVQKGMVWDTKKDEFRLTYEEQVAFDKEIGTLQIQYSPLAVGQAQQAFRNLKKREATPAELRAVLEARPRE